MKIKHQEVHCEYNDSNLWLDLYSAMLIVRKLVFQIYQDTKAPESHLTTTAPSLHCNSVILTASWMPSAVSCCNQLNMINYSLLQTFIHLQAICYYNNFKWISWFFVKISCHGELLPSCCPPCLGTFPEKFSRWVMTWQKAEWEVCGKAFNFPRYWIIQGNLLSVVYFIFNPSRGFPDENKDFPKEWNGDL